MNEEALVCRIKKKATNDSQSFLLYIHFYYLTCLIIHSYFILVKNMTQRFLSWLSSWSLERLGSEGRYPLQLNPSKRALTWFLVHVNPMDSCIAFVGFSFLPFLLVFGLIETPSERPPQSTSVPGLLLLLNTVSGALPVNLHSLDLSRHSRLNRRENSWGRG